MRQNDQRPEAGLQKGLCGRSDLESAQTGDVSHLWSLGSIPSCIFMLWRQTDGCVSHLHDTNLNIAETVEALCLKHIEAAPNSHF